MEGHVPKYLWKRKWKRRKYKTNQKQTKQHKQRHTHKQIDPPTIAPLHSTLTVRFLRPYPSPHRLPLLFEKLPRLQLPIGLGTSAILLLGPPAHVLGQALAQIPSHHLSGSLPCSSRSQSEISAPAPEHPHPSSPCYDNDKEGGHSDHKWQVKCGPPMMVLRTTSAMINADPHLTQDADRTLSPPTFLINNWQLTFSLLSTYLCLYDCRAWGFHTRTPCPLGDVFCSNHEPPFGLSQPPPHTARGHPSHLADARTILRRLSARISSKGPQ